MNYFLGKRITRLKSCDSVRKIDAIRARYFKYVKKLTQKMGQSTSTPRWV